MFNGIKNKEYWARFKNPALWISLVGLIVLLLNQFGYIIDAEWADTTIKLVCGIAVLLGLMNNPETGGIDLPKGGK
jgi:uncharacterized membrane protein